MENHRNPEWVDKLLNMIKEIEEEKCSSNDQLNNGRKKEFPSG